MILWILQENPLESIVKSYGIIVFNDHNEMLMVRRRNSYGYYEFIKKRYSIENLPSIIDEMTIQEKRLLMETTLPPNVIFLLKRSKTKWETPEWGFPKGKKLLYESQLECAFREFEEETGLKRNVIKLTNQKVSELFTAPNGKRYQHIYYTAYLRSQFKGGVDLSGCTQGLQRSGPPPLHAGIICTVQFNFIS